ncbi:MAG: CHAT domain-containing protein [Chloroflexota bacterium]|nr:CHAT domain-containing protein [Chloroflexota bacterium]
MRTLAADLRDKESADARRREGRRLLRRQSGPRRENLEESIKHFQFARKVYERHNLRKDWAATLNDLAQAYRVRLCGDPSYNQEKAIRLYLEAQKVYTHDDYPREWAIIQFNLGNAYLRRIPDKRENKRENNHQRAEKCYKGALLVFSEEYSPYQWARVYNSLGMYYQEAVIGNRTDNLEDALNCFKQALRVFKPDRHLVDWADVENNLGTAWRHRIRGSRTDNLEESIRCYKAALQVLDSARHEHLWGDVHHNLGVSYAERAKGNRADNLQKAQEHLESALRARRSAGLTNEVAKTQRELLILGITGQLGDQAEQIKQAIEDLKQIEQTVSKQTSPLEWARIELGLGNAYIERVRGDRVRNIEAAIEHFEKALEVITAHNAPAEWSYIQIGLAAAYRVRPIQDRRENLNKAIDGLCSGLDILLKKGWLSEWARMQNNLAGAYWDRGRYYRNVSVENEKADADFRWAIDHAQEALTLYSQHDYPFEWALGNYTIGNALSDLTPGADRTGRLTEAIKHFKSALEVFADQTYPLQRAWALNDYGVTLLNLAHAAPGKLNQRDLRNAIHLFREAIQTHKDPGLRTEILRSMINLGALYHALGLRTEAYTEMNQAVEIIETLRADALGESGHVHIAEQYTRAYQYLVDTCVRRGKQFWKEALERVEASKGRSFLAEMGTDDYPVPVSLPITFRDEEVTLLRSLREIENDLRGLETNPLEEREKKQKRNTLFHRQEQETVKYDALLKEIEPHAPDYVALRRGNPATYSDLQSLLDQAEKQIGVVELFPVKERILTFVMRSGWRSPKVVMTDLDEETLRATYLKPFEPVLKGRRTRAWMGDLGDRLFSEVLPHLTDVDLVYLVPTGPLHALPLHTLPVNNQTLIERFPIAYAPSLTTLSRVVARARHRSHEDGKRALVVGNPTNDLPSLASAEAVAREVASRFGVEPLLRDQATKQAVLDKLPMARVVYFVCHGEFDDQTPMYSGLHLARTGSNDRFKDILTVREIMQMRLSADLVVLSACQSGLNRVRRGDELIGLARAFLYAGASTVIVALWSVSETSATKLMRDFFDRLYPEGRKKTRTVTAMYESCLNLQEQYAGFFDWGPFIMVGDWK